MPTRTSTPACPTTSASPTVDGLSSPAFADWGTERKVELALAIERAARAHEGISQVENAVYSDAEGSVSLVNSRGFSASFEATQAWAYASAFAGEGEDLMTGLGVGLGRDPEALDPQAIGDEAAQRALALMGARRPESRRCPVVLDAFVAASFLGFIGSMLSAEAVQRGRSLFAGREGDEVADPALALVDDGTQPDGPGSAPFDGEGASTRRTPLIEGGRLLGFLYDSRTARRAGTETTGNASRGSYRSPPSVGTTNLLIEPGERGPRRARAAGRRGPLRDRRGRSPLGRQPGLRNVLRRRLRPPDHERGARRAGSGIDHRERSRVDAQGGPGGGL